MQRLKGPVLPLPAVGQRRCRHIGLSLLLMGQGKWYMFRYWAADTGDMYLMVFLGRMFSSWIGQLNDLLSSLCCIIRYSDTCIRLHAPLLLILSQHSALILCSSCYKRIITHILVSDEGIYQISELRLGAKTFFFCTISHECRYLWDFPPGIVNMQNGGSITPNNIRAAVTAAYRW